MTFGKRSSPQCRTARARTWWRAAGCWPPGYGQGTCPGFGDGLSDHLLHSGQQQVVLVLAGFSRAHAVDQAAALTLLDMLSDIARWHLLFGRQLICLVETEDPDLDLPESRGRATWNRHERLLVHREGTRLPPWIARDPTAYQTTTATKPAHARQLE
jgi:hypothetical protein